MKRLIGVFLVFSLFLPAAWSYDKDLAAKHLAFFSHCTRENLKKSNFNVTPKMVLEWIRDGEPVVFLDVRTRAEQSVVGITYKNTLHIPISELFKPENLKKLPTDKKIVVVCYTGLRAALATMALREIGFKNAYRLKGGIVGLAKATTVKTAP